MGFQNRLKSLRRTADGLQVKGLMDAFHKMEMDEKEIANSVAGRSEPAPSTTQKPTTSNTKRKRSRTTTTTTDNLGVNVNSKAMQPGDEVVLTSTCGLGGPAPDQIVLAVVELSDGEYEADDCSMGPGRKRLQPNSNYILDVGPKKTSGAAVAAPTVDQSVPLRAHVVLGGPERSSAENVEGANGRYTAPVVNQEELPQMNRGLKPNGPQVDLYAIWGKVFSRRR